MTDCTEEYDDSKILAAQVDLCRSFGRGFTPTNNKSLFYATGTTGNLTLPRPFSVIYDIPPRPLNSEYSRAWSRGRKHMAFFSLSLRNSESTNHRPSHHRRLFSQGGAEKRKIFKMTNVAGNERNSDQMLYV